MRRHLLQTNFASLEITTREQKERDMFIDIEQMTKDIQMLEMQEKPIRRNILEIFDEVGSADVIQDRIQSLKAKIQSTEDEKVHLNRKLSEIWYVLL